MSDGTKPRDTPLKVDRQIPNLGPIPYAPQLERDGERWGAWVQFASGFLVSGVAAWGSIWIISKDMVHPAMICIFAGLTVLAWTVTMWCWGWRLHAAGLLAAMGFWCLLPIGLVAVICGVTA